MLQDSILDKISKGFLIKEVELFGVPLEMYGNGIIRRLEGNYGKGEPGKGYRFSNEFGYALYDVYWQKISNHYLIQEQSRRRQLLWSKAKGIKPMFGPFPVEILEPETSEDSVDKRCLEILKNRVELEARVDN